ncbi:hypothetical protein ACVDFE_02035 [Lentzea chajnantorensis]
MTEKNCDAQLTHTFVPLAAPPRTAVVRCELAPHTDGNHRCTDPNHEWPIGKTEQTEFEPDPPRRSRFKPPPPGFSGRIVDKQGHRWANPGR